FSQFAFPIWPQAHFNAVTYFSSNRASAISDIVASALTGDQDDKLRALPAFARAKAKRATDLTNKRFDDPHAQSLAGEGIKIRRQQRPAIGNGQHADRVGVSLQADIDPPFAVFD